MYTINCFYFKIFPLVLFYMGSHVGGSKLCKTLDNEPLVEVLKAGKITNSRKTVDSSQHKFLIIAV